MTTTSRSKKRVYYIYEVSENGIPLLRGTARELEREIGIRARNIGTTYASRGCLYKGRYSIKKIGEITAETYNLTKDDGTVVFTGTSKEIKNKFNLSTTSVGSYVGRGKLLGKYNVDKTYKRRVKKETDLDFKSNPVGYLYHHLKLYGNTITMSDPHQYLEELSNMGLSVNVTKNRDHYYLEAQ